MMQVVGFDGRNHDFNYTKNKSRKSRSNKSSYHIQARKLLRDYFSGYSIYEEVTLPGSKKAGRRSLLYADFFIPEAMLIVEVHGEQHYSFSSFFHKSKYDFFKSKKRDKDKIKWCKLNDIEIIVLSYNEREKWKQMISEKRSRD
jgi:hypothetical protein